MKDKKVSNDLCIVCKERAVRIKCRGLCDACYRKERKSGFKNKARAFSVEVSRATAQKIQNRAEIEFVKNFFHHTNWIHQPASFRCNGTYYQPDFYDQERNTFIEVAGTRQAYEQNKNKYKIFRDYFPSLNFEIRKEDGTLVVEEDRIDWSLNTDTINY